MLTVFEMARRCGVSTKTISEWQRKGRIRGHAIKDRNQFLFEDPGANPPRKHVRGVSALQNKNLHICEYTMNQAQRCLCRALVLSCIVSGYASLGFGQASDPKSAAVVDQIMATALARRYSTGTGGFKRIDFVTPINEEFAQMKALGQKAIVPLAFCR